jgi:alkylation response protein AidB-like acyl-CoA dehydrogenase
VQFELSPEEELLRETVADFSRAHFGAQPASTASGADWGSAWRAFAELGLAGILVPEEFGGSGGTLVDACVIAEQLGRADAWIPFAGTGILAASVLCAADEPDGKVLADLAAGGSYSLLLDDRLGWPAAVPRIAIDWHDGGHCVVLTDDGPFVVDGAGLAPVEQPDLLHPCGQTTALLSGRAAPLSPGLRWALAVSRVGLSAWLTGVAAVALDSAVEYAKSRRQFGVPIGSFQAVQHLCADMLVDVETSRSITYGAAWTVANRSLPEAERIAAAAKSWCSRSAVRVCETSIQVFGGIGVTWEHPAHLRLRTARQFAGALGGFRELDRELARARLSAGRDADGSE